MAQAHAWGNLSTFAATLRKGAHLAVEGELRYREFVPKKQKKQKNGDNKVRVAEIHLWRIAKLDRAEKRDSDSRIRALGARAWRNWNWGGSESDLNCWQ
jgi:single-strand DNA-binding protein